MRNDCNQLPAETVSTTTRRREEHMYIGLGGILLLILILWLLGVI